MSNCLNFGLLIISGKIRSTQNMHIIGITGNPSSGKDTIAHHLETKGFLHISSGDLLRAEMKKYGLLSDRAHMHDFVIEMRKKRGPAYLAEEAAKVISGDTIISGLRNVAEVEVLRKLFGKQFALLAVDAPIEVRYERSKGRGRAGDHVSFEQFRVQEESERHGRPEAQQVDDVIAMADYSIKNEGTKEELLEKANLFLEGLSEND